MYVFSQLCIFSNTNEYLVNDVLLLNSTVSCDNIAVMISKEQETEMAPMYHQIMTLWNWMMYWNLKRSCLYMQWYSKGHHRNNRKIFIMFCSTKLLILVSVMPQGLDNLLSRDSNNINLQLIGKTYSMFRWSSITGILQQIKSPHMMNVQVKSIFQDKILDNGKKN